jgi:hypothetical protein
MAISKIPSAGFQDNVKFRNIIINGDMSIAQRGTSQASITSAGYYTVDRFRTAISSLGTFTQSQDSDVPSGQGFTTSLKMDCTTADASPSASDQLLIQQRIEGQNLQYLKKGTANAESLTLSFWVKSNKTGTYVANILDNDNSRQISNSYTINASNTWEKKTLTFAGDTTGVFGNDNNTSIELNFWLGAGSTYTSGTLQTSWTSTANADLAVGQVNLADSTSNEWYITGVQLEAGTTASDFEFLPHDVNENRCMRYFEYTTGANSHGGLYAGTTYIGHVFYKVRKRTRPTLSDWTGTSGSTLNNSSGGDRGGTDNMYYTNQNAGAYVIVGKIDAEL